MKKILLLIIILLSVKAEAQIESRSANLEIPILIYDNSAPPYNSQILTVGLDSTATDGLDPHLDEYGLPCAYHFFMETECPPIDMFKAILHLPPFDQNAPIGYKDFRFGLLPYTGQKEHRIRYQTHSSATALYIEWDFPPGVLAQLQDMFGGMIINEALIGSGIYTMPANLINLGQLRLIMNYYNVGGNPAGPLFVISDSTLSFPSIPIGGTTTLPVTVSNYGYLDTLYITDVVSSNNYFTISPETFPIGIAPLGSQTFNILYTAAVGAQVGSIQFTHNALGSPSTLMVTAPGSQAQDFGMINVNSGSYSHPLWFGVHPLATDSLDIELDEHDSPPLPPPGAPDTRLMLPLNNFSGSLSSYKDYRFGILPFSGQKEFRIAYQPQNNNDVRVSWYLPDGITGVLRDILTGSFINIPIADTGYFIVTDPIAFNRLKMLIDFVAITPVELISFSAKHIANAVALEWTTATETNSYGFEIERASSSTTPIRVWKKIGSVNGSGTTTEKHFYHFLDKNIPEVQKAFYRLKQIDLNGQFEYSNEIEVYIAPIEFALNQNYPNPFNPSTVIKYAVKEAGLVKVKVFDVLGNEVVSLVNETKEAGYHSVEFKAPNLPSGVYIYTLQVNGFSASQKMLLLK